MSKKFGFVLLCLPLLLTECAGRSTSEVMKGSRKKYGADAYWNVLAAAQGVLQRDGFVVNLSQQSKGVLVATLQKVAKKNKALNRIENITGASFRVGDYLRVMVFVQATKTKQTEMRLSVLRERENEWTQEDGDEIGNQEFYTDFFKRVDLATSTASPIKNQAPPQG